MHEIKYLWFNIFIETQKMHFEYANDDNNESCFNCDLFFKLYWKSKFITFAIKIKHFAFTDAANISRFMVKLYFITQNWKTVIY